MNKQKEILPHTIHSQSAQFATAGGHETNAVAGYPSGLDNFMTVIKIHSHARQDDDGGRRDGRGALSPVPPTELVGPCGEPTVI